MDTPENPIKVDNICDLTYNNGIWNLPQGAAIMGNLFNYDNKIMHILTNVIDGFILGLLWLLCCIPVVTVGASSTAFYYAFNKGILREQGYPWKEFFHGFKTNFKQATILWLIMMLLFFVLYLDIYILTSGILKIGIFAPLLLTTALVILVIVVIWALCAFPYLARFENTTKATIKTSFVLSFANLHWSFLLLVFFVGSILLFFRVPIINLFAPAVYMFFANRILERIFQKYMRPEDLEDQQA